MVSNFHSEMADSACLDLESMFLSDSLLWPTGKRATHVRLLLHHREFIRAGADREQLCRV